MAQNKRNIQRLKGQDKTQQQEKKGKALRGIFAAIGIVALSVGGGMVSSYVMGNPEISLAENIEKILAKEAVVRTVSMDTFLLNLKQADNGARYLKIDLAVSMDSDEDEALFNTHLAKIRDNIIGVLRKKSGEALMAETTEGQLAIKQELLDTVNSASGAEVIDDIYITNIVTQ